jgi:hypothetical protein
VDEARFDDVVQVPASVRFPLELVPPDGFDPADLSTWPRIDGRLEWVGARLLYMPPCGEMQQVTVIDVSGTLWLWSARIQNSRLAATRPACGSARTVARQTSVSGVASVH